MKTTNTIQPSEVTVSGTKPSEATPSEDPTTKLTQHSNNDNGYNMGRSQNEPVPLKRSSRVRKPTQRLITAMIAEMNTPSEGVLPHNITLPPEEHVSGELLAMQSLFPDYNLHQDDDPLFAMKAASDPDTVYYHEAMRTPDRAHFIQAMENEMNANLNSKNLELVHKSTIPQDATVLPSVWQLRRKRHLSTGKIKKYKVRINVDGSKQIKSKHYDLTYAPVASWSIIRLIITIAAVKKWPSKQLDYVLAFPQAPIERDLYMKIPKGYQVQDANSKDYVLKLNNNLYGQKQAGRVWNQFLTEKLIQVGFRQSKYDQCVFYRKNVIYILYTDDSIITGPSISEIDEAINAIKKTQLQLTEEGDVQDFLGVNITRNDDGSIKFHQPLLIDGILRDLKLPQDGKIRETPAQSSSILTRHHSSKDHDQSFNYRSILGKLGYLEKGSRPEIAYIVHQCARFSIHPKIEHARAIRWLAKYLRGTRDQGMIMQPDIKKGLELFVDADFAGNWDPQDTGNVDTARSRHGYVIKFANCPIIWKSQLQREIALSSTESEYTGLSYAVREVIPILNILQELSKTHNLLESPAKLYLRVYEDNAGAIEMAKVHKYRPRTKHLNIRLHHFRKFISSGRMKIFKIHTNDQQADIFTKPLASEQFLKLRKLILGW